MTEKITNVLVLSTCRSGSNSRKISREWLDKLDRTIQQRMETMHLALKLKHLLHYNDKQNNSIISCLQELLYFHFLR